MSRQAGELDKILAEQKKILSETDSIDRELKRSVEEETEKRLDRMTASLRETLSELRRLLPSEEGDPILEMEKLLKEKRIERLWRRAKLHLRRSSPPPGARVRFDRGSPRHASYSS